jgi:hypothetical protein
MRLGVVASQYKAHSKRFLQSAVDFIIVSSLFPLINVRKGRSVWIADFLIAKTGTQQAYESGKVSRGEQQDWMQQREGRSGSVEWWFRICSIKLVIKSRGFSQSLSGGSGF